MTDNINKQNFISEISVIIISKDRYEYLEELLLSLNLQTFTKFEIIIIDNGSKHSTKKFIEEYNSCNYPLKKIYLEKEHSIGYCRNYVFQNNCLSDTSKYVYFIDDDDIIFRNTLNVLYKKITKSKSNIVYCNTAVAFCNDKLLHNEFQYINYKESIKHLIVNLYVKYIGLLLFRRKKWLLAIQCSTVSTHSILYDRKLFSIHRFKETNYCEDVFFRHDIYSDIKKISSLPTHFVIYRKHNSNITSRCVPYSVMDMGNSLSFQFLTERYSAEDVYFSTFTEYIRQLVNLLYLRENDSNISLRYIDEFEKNAKNVSLFFKFKTYFFFQFYVYILIRRLILLYIQGLFAKQDIQIFADENS
jgi:glycosyltransferase involved in cell wall biosynthesis